MRDYLKIGIVGSRRRNTKKDKEILRKVLCNRLKKGYSLMLVSGGCPKGADRFAEELAEELKLPIAIYNPDKKLLPENPSYHDYVKMYYSRNTQIAEFCDVLVALPADDRRGGTENTIETAKSLNKPVLLL